ncbi:4'-phosphopantetheinyl transferase family protein [Haloimpatiens sp. FM7330]|uniref:4'-phosphopantetheinyl transferase family protein n=1 Tax=Haloimpatiens sp. FM7330 TaxID=3298610 RepID=UPI003629C73E
MFSLKQEKCSLKRLQSILDITEDDLDIIKSRETPFIYLIDLTNFDVDIKFTEILIEEEIERCNKFKFKGDKQRFTINRMIIRIVVGRLLHKHPKNVGISYNYYGKPYIDDKYKLEFNISHSEEYIAIAFCKNKVGIDVEFMKKDIDYLEIVKSYFDEEEFKQLMKLNDNDRLLCFYQLWVAKESYIKAIGYGLSYSIKKVVIPNITYGKNLLIDKKSGKKICVEVFKIDENYVGSIVYIR